MLRCTRSCQSAYCNVARGASRIIAAFLPSGVVVPSLSIFPETFSTTYSEPLLQEGEGKEGQEGLLSNNTLSTLSSLSATAQGQEQQQKNRKPQPLSQDLVHDLTNSSYQESKNMRQKAVPATRTTRAFGFTSLFMQLGWDKLTGSTPSGGLLSTQGHQHIVDTLCRMRGAVLKLGQMLSIQDANTVPAHVTALFEKVRDQAFAMPAGQLNKALAKAFGSEMWRTNIFNHFDNQPIAAASIGQVHYARLKKPPPPLSRSTTEAGMNWEDGQEVAVKVQYPGVARSIDSDVANLKLLMSLNILPPGMFVDSILQELRAELQMECQYTLEAAKQSRYRDLVAADADLCEALYVPRVFETLSTDQVLISEFVRGVPIDQVAKRAGVPQDFKNYLMENMMRLTLRELFSWNFMQTDPNYANFLYDAKNNRVNLLDFGAAREYDPNFVNEYLDVVAAAARCDREEIIAKSITLGFLTGREVKEMLDAHVSSVMLLGEAFRNRNGLFDFSAVNIPEKIQAHVPTMIKLRLRPPSTPIYSLHRRLSGTILMATKFGASIPSGKIFWEIYDERKALLKARTV